MEWIESFGQKPTISHLALLSFQRYYFYYRRRFLPYSHKWIYFVHVLEILQLLAVLIPAESDRKAPWNYSPCGAMWQFLALVTRPEVLSRKLELPDSIVYGIYAGLIAIKLVTSSALAVSLGLMDGPTFSTTTSDSRISTLCSDPILLLNFLSGLALKALFVPMTSFCALQSITHYPSPTFAGDAVLLSLCVVVRVTDAAYIGSSSWFQHDLESIAVCTDRIYLLLTKLAHVLVCSWVDFTAHGGYFAGALVAIGVYAVLKTVYTVPFHEGIVNCFAVTKAVVSLWGGVCLIVGGMDQSPQETMKATLLFFALWPGIVVVAVARIPAMLKSSLHAQNPVKLFQIEHYVRLHIRSGRLSKEVDEVFNGAFMLYPKSPQLAVWALYYYQHLEDVTFVQVSISKLMKMHWSLASFIECLYCVFLVEEWLHSLSDQAEALDFVLLQRNMQKVTAADFETSKLHFTLFSELSSKYPSFQKVEKLALDLNKSMKRVSKLYRTLLKRHPNSSEILVLYSQFLLTLTSARDGMKIQTLAQRAIARMEARRHDQSVDFFDQHCMIVVMSLEKQSLGLVTWAQNPAVLGFEQSEVVGSDHAAVIPLPLKRDHTEKLRRITEFRHHHPVYESRHLLYFANREGMLVGAYWKVRLINMPGSGDMAIIAGLKRRKDAPVVAFLDTNQQTVVAMVRSTQTKQFRKKMEAVFDSACPDVFTMAEAFGEEHSQWVDGETVYEHEDTERSTNGLRFIVKCDTFVIFGIYAQPVLKVFYESSTARTTAHTYQRPAVENSNIFPEDFLDSRMWSENPVSMLSSGVQTASCDPTSKLQSIAATELESRYNSRSKRFLISNYEDSGNTIFHSTFDDSRDSLGLIQRFYKTHKIAQYRAVKMMDWSVAGIAALLLTALLLIVVRSVDPQDFHGKLREFENMNRRRELTVEVAMKVREPFLQSGGYPLPSSSQSLSALIDELHSQSSIIQEQSDIDIAYRTAHFSVKGTWWEYHSEGYSTTLRNSMEMLNLLASHALPLATEDPLSPTDVNYLSVLHNGGWEALHTLNRSMAEVTRQQTADCASGEQQTLGVFVAGTVGVSAALTLAVVFFTRRVGKVRQKIYQVLRKIPASMFAVAKASSKDHLEMFHNTDFSELESDPEQAVRGSIIPHFDWVFYLSSIFLMMVILTAGLFVLYFNITEEARTFGKEVPRLMYVSGLRKLGVMTAKMYLREAANGSQGLSDAFSSGQFFYNISLSCFRQISQFTAYERELQFSDAGKRHISSTMQHDLYARNDSQPSVLRFGTHSALLSLAQEMRHYASIGDKSGLAALEQQTAAVLSALDQLTDSYRSDAFKAVQIRGKLYWLGSFSIVTLFLAVYVLLARQFLQRITSRTNHQWRILFYLPRTCAADLCRLLQSL